nr:hypothetical protein CFP56_33738 [Quercus suber]
MVDKPPSEDPILQRQHPVGQRASSLHGVRSLRRDDELRSDVSQLRQSFGLHEHSLTQVSLKKLRPRRYSRAHEAASKQTCFSRCGSFSNSCSRYFHCYALSRPRRPASKDSSSPESPID